MREIASENSGVTVFPMPMGIFEPFRQLLKMEKTPEKPEDEHQG